MYLKTRVLSFKVALIGLLIAWLIKYPDHFQEYIHLTAQKFPISFNFFPRFLQSQQVLTAFYYLPLATILLLYTPHKRLKGPMLFTGAFIFWLASVMLLFHQATYNDATFNVIFWVSLWLLWFSLHLNADEEYFRRHLLLFSKLIVSLIFMGGFIGKLSGDWWSGTILFGIYENFFNHFPFDYMQNKLSLEAQFSIISILAKFILFIELMISLAIFVKDKLYFRIIPFVILGVIFFRSWQILSVIAPMIFMLLANLLYIKQQSKTQEQLDKCPDERLNAET